MCMADKLFPRFAYRFGQPVLKCVLMTQDLDEAARRRMPKQLYVPLPDAATRQKMFARKLGKT